MSAFQPKSDFVRILSERGFIHQVTDIERLDARASSGRITAYIGFDATANSLHVGNLVQIMMLRWLQKTGHRPLCVMGGGTTKVGDPSGKDATRPLITEAQIAENLAGIKRAFDAYLTFGDGPSDAQFVNNAEWLEGFGYIEFLRAFGPHFTINRMLTFDSVKLRLEREQPLTFIEFNYMLMQAVDFLELHQRYGCSLQMGGSDQWGNIVNGVELVRRKAEGEAFGLTTPLLTTASGAKMGKTAAGAVWLNADRLSIYDYWQFWRNADDADVERFLKLYTDMPLDEIARLSALQGAEINEAKKSLADAATTLLHGPEAALSARQAAQTAFEQGGVSADMPSYDLPRSELQQGLQLATLIRDAGLAASSSDARRLASGGGLRVNDVSEPDAARLLTLQDVADSGVIKIAAGKKKIVIVNVV